MIALHLLDKAALSTAYQDNITPIVSGWKRKTRAVGGYDTASFDVTGPRESLLSYYNRWLGCGLIEYTYGLSSWEGMISQLDLVLDGVNYRRTLDLEWFHNKVKVFYRYPDTSDDADGSLSYTTESGHATFTDDGQDFNDWETTSGDAQFRLVVTNNDYSECWGFLGAAVSATEIYVWKDIELTERGWNGEISGMTPMSYDVIDIELAGKQQETSWDSVADSISEYGERRQIVSLGSATAQQAEAVRQTHLDEFAWPRSRIVGRVKLGDRKHEDVLSVKVAGYWHTLNWRYKESSTVGAASRLIEDFIDTADFVTTGLIEENAASCRVEATSSPQRYGDLITEIIERGDDSGNKWQGGVYNNQEFVYEQAPTWIEYHLRDGRLLTKPGAEVIPSLIRPGAFIQDRNAPTGGRFTGSDVWDDPQVAYVEEVEFRAPDQLSLRLYGGEATVELMRQELEALERMPASRR